jgi:response regulator RpfG family c-di-GMP phosphodiesterase
VKDALDRSALLKEKKRLEALVIAQNEELKVVNASLELRVEARTAELRQSNQALNKANDKLKSNFLTSIKMFTALIELRDGKLAGHSRRVADMSRRLAQAMGLDNKQVQEVFVAGLLHTIGMVGFDDELLHTPVSSMTPRQLELYHEHPLRAEQLLMPLAELKSTVEIIVAQLERHDGSGYPQGIAGRHIPLGARLLALVSDYDSLQIGVLEPGKLSPQQAREVIRQRRSRYYDPVVADVFLEITLEFSTEGIPPDAATTRSVKSRELTEGMVLARDLTSPTGLLLLTAGHVLDNAVIQKIFSFERSIDTQLIANVWVGTPPAED